MAKQSKQSVEYTDDHGTSNEQCSKCTHFLYPNGCSEVTGPVKPGGWCKLFSRK